MSVKISARNRQALGALHKKHIYTRLNEQYPKLLETVHSNIDETAKVQTVYKFISLLEELVDEINTTNIRS
jgi:hypothetical protein